MSRTQRRWSPQEDEVLQKEVEAQIAADDSSVRDWSSIAQKIDGRSNKDCRKRYYNGITQGLKKGPWTAEEDELLKRLIDKHGPSWVTVLKPQNLETPQDTPPCCSNRRRKRRDAVQNDNNVSCGSDNSADLFGRFCNDVDSVFDGSTGTNFQANDPNKDYSFPSLDAKNPFEAIGEAMQLNAMTPGSMSDNFGQLGLQRPSNKDPSILDFDLENFDFQMQDALPSSVVYPRTQPNGSQNFQYDSGTETSSKSHGRGQSMSDAFDRPLDLNPGHHDQHHPSPSSTETTLASSNAPPNSTKQTTIRFEDVNPSIVSAIIGLLVESNSRFVYETR
ncbi:MAG: hypothetical protein Q9181_004278 [Wetmoreana brouardii]